MDLNEVAIFIKVIQKGSFTAAAQALDMPKSTVSMKISSLEARLGTTLLTRSTRKLRLTPAGEAFFLRSTKAVEEIAAAELAVRSEHVEPQGLFRITAPVDIGNAVMAELTANFLKKYPKVELEIFLTDRQVDFLEDKIDLAIRAGDLKDSSLIAKKVGEASFMIVASPKYIKAFGVPSGLKELKNHNCIVFTPVGRESWSLKNANRSVEVQLPKKTIANDLNLCFKLALEGTGIALLPPFLCESELSSGKLVHVLKEWKTKTVPLHFVYPAQRYVQPVIKAFIESAAVSLKNRFSF